MFHIEKKLVNKHINGVRGTRSADPLNFSLPYYGSYRLQIVAV